MMKCSKCGFENADEAVFCTGCGAQMEEAPVEQQPVQAAEAPVADTSAYAPAADTSAYSAPVDTAPAEKNTATLWLILNIVLTVLCCGNILGIIGIVFAAMGMGSYKKGNYDEMNRKVKTAKLLFIIGAILGVIGTIIALATGLIPLIMSMADMRSFY